MMTRENYHDALMLASRHRFAEVVEALAKVTASLAEDAHHLNETSRWLACHPLVRLYMEQLAVLSNNGPGPHNTWRAALNFAQKAALGKEASTEIGGNHYRFTPEVAGNGGS